MDHHPAHRGPAGGDARAYRDVRVDLGDLVPAEALPEILADLEAEGLRLRAAARSASLLYDALQGRRYIPRL